MGFFSRLKSIAGNVSNAAGGVLKKVGDFSSNVISKIDGGRQLYNLANQGTGGVLGNLLESIPGVGAVKGVVDKLGGVGGILHGAQNVAHKISDTGSKIQGIGGVINRM